MLYEVITLQRVGVSRKIEDEKARRRLRQIMKNIQPPAGLGYIIRTAGVITSYSIHYTKLYE